MVSEEYYLIKAHRVILSAGSSFFRTVLTSLEANPHTMFYLKGVSSSNLSCMLDFIYCGETKVPKKNLETFLRTAKDFGVLGLHIENELVKHINYKEKIVEDLEIKQDNIMFNTSEEFTEGYKMNDTDTLTMCNERSSFENSSVPYIETTVEQFRELTNQMCIKKGNIWTCTECGEEKGNNKGNLLDHVELHLVGLQYPCDICGKIFSHATTVQ